MERNWVLGANAWGSSFIVGAGSTFPHCMQHQVANLSGSLNGTPPIVLGATVDGPSAAANFQGVGTVSGMRACPPNGNDPFKAFSGKGARYFDNVIAWPSVEPADDYTALGIVLFAGQAALG
jgi:endoglucanase